jgi:hypothetical protein
VLMDVTCGSARAWLHQKDFEKLSKDKNNGHGVHSNEGVIEIWDRIAHTDAHVPLAQGRGDV